MSSHSNSTTNANETNNTTNTRNKDTLELNEKLSLMKEDYDNEWWRPSKLDNYDLKSKLLRVGCRPLKRKLMKCQYDYKQSEYFKDFFYM